MWNSSNRSGGRRLPTSASEVKLRVGPSWIETKCWAGLLYPPGPKGERHSLLLAQKSRGRGRLLVH